MRFLGHQRLPPEVREIVAEAGAENCFYWSGRGPVQKPSVGLATPRMTNLVPGASLTVTAGATSEQAISANGSIDFQGDDFYDLSYSGLTDEVTVALLIKRDVAGGDNFYFLEGRDSSVTQQIRVISNGENSIRWQIRDSDSVTGRLTATVNMLSAQAVVATMSLTDDFVRLFTSSGRLEDNAVGFTGEIDIAAGSMKVGSAFAGTVPWDGKVFESFVAFGHAISNSRAIALRDCLASRQGVA